MLTEGTGRMISAMVKQPREMMTCQVRLARMKVNIKQCKVELSQQTCLPYVIKSQTCLPGMRQCRVRLRKFKIATKPCRVELATLSHRETSPAGKTLSQVVLGELLQFQPQPRTVRQRMKNSQLLSKYNSEYQDDLFDQMPSMGRGFSLLSTTSSESDDNMSTTSTTSNSSTGPLLSWPVTNSKSPPQPSTPLSPTTDLGSFQHCAFIHQRLKERRARPNIASRWSCRRARSCWRRRHRSAEEFKEMVGQVKAVVQGEENSTWSGCDSGVESYFSDVDKEV